MPGNDSYDYIKEKAARLREQDLRDAKVRKERARQLRRQERREAFREFWEYHRVLKWVLCILAGVLVAALIACIYIWITYRVDTVYVEGSTHYTDQEITDMVLTGPLEHNSLYLSLRYKNAGVTGIPFVEKMDVSIVDAHTIRINVYEKALAGYVVYLGNYMYFDRTGTVVEASKEKTEGIPEVTGLSFNYVVLYEKLPVKNEEVFTRILNVTQLLKKYELSADRIYFDSSENMTLYFGNVRAALGNDDNTDEKVSNLKQILPSLEGKSGVLDLVNYTRDSNHITFTEKSR